MEYVILYLLCYRCFVLTHEVLRYFVKISLCHTLPLRTKLLRITILLQIFNNKLNQGDNRNL